MTKMTLSAGRSPMQKSNFFKKFSAISGQLIVAGCLILLSSQSILRGCHVHHYPQPRRRPPAYCVLMLGVDSGCTHLANVAMRP